MFTMFSRPAGYEGLHVVGHDDLMKELGVTLEEAKFIGKYVQFNFWYVKDENGNYTKFITADGCDDYVDFDFRNYLLGNILDFCLGCMMAGKFSDIRNKMLSIPNVRKYVNVGITGYSIKNYRKDFVWKFF